MNIAIITGCTKMKLDHPAQAQDMYLGVFFKSIKAFATKMQCDFYILSAKYGLIPHNKIIEPYDRKLKDTPADKNRLRIQSDEIIEQLIKQYDYVVFLMGVLYQSVFDGYEYPNIIYFKEANLGKYAQLGQLVNRLNRSEFERLINHVKGKHKFIDIHYIQMHIPRLQDGF